MLTLMLYTQPVITQTSVPCYFIHTASSRMHFLSHSTKQVFSLDLLSLTFPATVLFPFKAFSKLFLLYDAKISQMSVYSLYYSAASFLVLLYVMFLKLIHPEEYIIPIEALKKDLITFCTFRAIKR